MDELKFPKKLLELGDREGAAKEIVRLLKTSPQNINAWFLLAEVIEDRSKKADCYRQILKLDRTNTQAKDRLIEIVNVKAINPPQPILKAETRSNSTDILQGMEQEKTEFFPQKQNANTPDIPNKQTEDSKEVGFFQLSPRYLTALAGFGIVAGVAFNWLGIGNIDGNFYYHITSYLSGLHTEPGILTLLAGIAIIAISFLVRTNPIRPASPISAIIAITAFIINSVWQDSMASYAILSGFMFSQQWLFFAMVTGLGLNPGKGKPNWSTYMAIVGMGLMTTYSIFMGSIAISFANTYYEFGKQILISLYPGLFFIIGIIMVIHQKVLKPRYKTSARL